MRSLTGEAGNEATDAHVRKIYQASWGRGRELRGPVIEMFITRLLLCSILRMRKIQKHVRDTK